MNFRRQLLLSCLVVMDGGAVIEAGLPNIIFTNPRPEHATSCARS